MLLQQGSDDYKARYRLTKEDRAFLIGLTRSEKPFVLGIDEVLPSGLDAFRLWGSKRSEAMDKLAGELMDRDYAFQDSAGRIARRRFLTIPGKSGKARDQMFLTRNGLEQALAVPVSAYKELAYAYRQALIDYRAKYEAHMKEFHAELMRVRSAESARATSALMASQGMSHGEQYTGKSKALWGLEPQRLRIEGAQQTGVTSRTHKDLLDAPSLGLDVMADGMFIAFQGRKSMEECGGEVRQLAIDNQFPVRRVRGSVYPTPSFRTPKQGTMTPGKARRRSAVTPAQRLQLSLDC